MPLKQANLSAPMSWLLQKPTGIGPNKNGPTSEGVTLTGLDLTVWTQLFMAEIVIFANFTITGDTHTSTSVTNVSAPDIAKLVVGQVLTGTGFATGTSVATIGTTSFTTNIATTATNAGVTITAQSAPIGLTAVASATGGTLTAATYYYRVTAVGNQVGSTSIESIGSNEPAGAVIATSTGSVALSWTALTGASAYNIYRGTSAGSENLLVGTVASSDGTTPPATTYTDTNSTSSSASPPGSAPAAFLEFDLTSFNNAINEAVVAKGLHSLIVLPLTTYSGATATCIYAPGTTNGWAGPYSSTTTVTTPLGGEQSEAYPGSSATGWTVDSTHKTIRITNGGYEALSVIVGAILRV